MKLNTNIKNCQKGRLSTGTMLLHDNVRLHTKGLTQSTLMTLKFEVLTHPVYSLGLSRVIMKFWICRRNFWRVNKCSSTNEGVKKVVKEWMLQVGWNFGEMQRINYLNVSKNVLTRTAIM